MPITIACLHTAESNAALFDTAAAALPGGALRLTHRVRPDLLREPTPDTLAEAAAILRDLAWRSDVVLLTCSTIGGAVEFARDAPKPVIRADGALAEAATRAGGEVHVLYAAPSSRESTRNIFGEAAAATGARVSLHLVPGAWRLFLAGEHAAYLQRIADMAQGMDGRVVLAQASMAPAAALMADHPPLTIPGIAVMAAARAARARKLA
ncbi:hypothetical protein [Roseococcus sp. YIM B11640]|uniref:hypothetical protein n=1 Tax=Roseococcus sp. YIM B11640 TaxID=3133973 RepID=UPI003C7C0143